MQWLTLPRSVGSVLTAMIVASAAQAADATDPSFLTSDVDRFYAVYDAANGHPTPGALQRDYLDAGSDGLHQFAKSRGLTGSSLAAAIAKDAGVFRDARTCVGLLPKIRQRVADALRRLAALYPAATFPPVTIVIGRASTGGTTSASGVIIGLETLCAASYIDPDPEDRFVHLIAHEFVHVQQPAAEDIDDTGGSVLGVSLIEGGAEFVGALTSGDVAYTELRRRTIGHEGAFEPAFLADADRTDLHEWLYNGRGTDARPGDLGYRIGYRIVESYYLQAADKRQAIDDILHVTMANAHAFLDRSGWSPGIALPASIAFPPTMQ